jgi:hypothetical protein
MERLQFLLFALSPDIAVILLIETVKLFVTCVSSAAKAPVISF